ncbi:OBERON-like protein [Vitis vinifera]|uniref:OBERON-like protein n=1 Tax=Vitis vinifera TaxID=29760 RepID=A0A438DDT1_VITVI|nr:OBERON-like protein [Vitis vinifera]
MSLLDIARGEVDIISQRLKHLSEEFLEGLKNELRVILEGADGSQHGDEFLILQKLIQKRGDLTANTLTGAHRVQLEILVAINTGMQAFLHPSMSLSQTSLIEVFLFKRCRNIECQSQLPADDCTCKVCANTDGFCNLCMCVSCNKFDFEGNTCRWIGCDLCSHWTHTDCAIRDGQIGMGADVKTGAGTTEILFRCGACNRTSELLGWVKDIFQICAPSWDRQALMKELEFVTKIFRGSLDSRGRRLSWICEDLIEKMKCGMSESVACRIIMFFFQELEIESSRRKFEEIGRMIAPQEACSRISEVLQEAIAKMEKVEEERARMLKKARLDLEVCDRELENKAREMMELKMERKKKKEETEELESIARLKQAEADTWELKAIEARREAERLQSIALPKSHKAKKEHCSGIVISIPMNLPLCWPMKLTSATAAWLPWDYFTWEA